MSATDTQDVTDNGPGTPPTPDSTPSSSRLRGLLARLEFTGVILAVIFAWLSATPSLLPRGPLFQGVVTGGSAAIGYLLGVFAAWIVRYLLSRETRWPSPGPRVWAVTGIVAIVGTVIMVIFWYSDWQHDIRELMGVEQLSWWAYPTIIVVAVVVFVILMALGRGWAALIRWIGAGSRRIMPPRVARVVAASIVVLVTVFLVNGVIVDYSMRALNSAFAAANGETHADTNPTTSQLRSGGPGSLVSWDSLGRQGRTFIGTGPTTEQLAAFNKAPAVEPIRVFTGLDSADDVYDRAELAARELERTGGLKRKVVAIGSTTGSGWINRSAVDSIEYMFNGDTATVSMQYSFLPSWLSFLADQDRARKAGLALFEAVDERIRAMPLNERPKVVVFGESLGSFAGESAFGTIPSITARTNGALFVGPTFSNTVWNDATANRDDGSPQWLPIFNNGAKVRFVADPSDLKRPDAPWDKDRVVYLQHASDPITWWSPRLLLNKPDWLTEKRGRDVLPSTRWIPFVTFLQVSADMAVSTNVPDGHGHTFLAAVPYAWAQILQPPGWTDEKTAALVPLLTRS
ncbi:alpha/beta-hydrolase family protein [Gordonia sp. (in: high G+C Gram-positive bacteria)]|uniref:alpha/beta hydrolase n=2 Tax=Gordonia sp. (in: high G+C Gram-positive bacteria) TaxID=84139 RepID=UPI0026025B5F|nr:alpha/beta-hydrolase family protein [Gordonia sp. (in: high G+C Gram-positive bacteria)]HMS75688.1 alpha/beta-hydrolase family protein [Gordonia sp. (in: high G+C Gram-positive bacteria)]HQV17873.1 alpha/beta-hydrolase family protein [Gordonia sp. (in: high G+C Gram-positive bacteria)]